MSVDEYKLLGNILLATVVAFFGVALPGYAIMRRLWPENGWNLGGNVGTSVIQGLDLVIAGGFVVLFVVSWKELPESIKNNDLNPVTSVKILSSAVTYLLLAGLIPLVLFWRTNLAEFFGLRWGGWKNLAWILPGFVVSMFLLNLVMVFLGWPGWVKTHFNGGSQSAVRMLQESGDVKLLAAIAFSAVIVAPIAEELIFRGYIYPVVKNFSERWFAALFTGMLFGVVHFNLVSLPTLVVMGVVLVVLYEVTGSLWVTIGCHAAFNGTSVALMLLGKFYEVPIPK